MMYKRTDRISYLRRDPFCEKGRVKTGANFILKMILFLLYSASRCVAGGDKTPQIRQVATE